ncbi:hypothetical protein FNT36_24985 [Hymenobacter setariae]|uniref:Uncharacterized protein n=1 Tax=Hymenobacter setariae TaxID=2594794 RepID=A0A558BJS7_9BACT|nr:hypothetical protein [Hymenobacter setariae]TVT36772.1 hypothetical protein FNT36_24985 [Hymenobacter setariae]
MLSQYTWVQFFVFVLVLLVIYYVVVGFLYYRDDLAALLKGRKLAVPQLAGAGATASAAGPPSLVRAKSAFATAPTATEAATAEVEAPEDGAAENLPEASAAVVGGELPSSTATATGRDDSTDDEGPMDAASSVAGATDEAVAMDADREEQADQPNEALAAIIRKKAHAAQPEHLADGSAEGEENTSAVVIEETNSEGANIENKHPHVEALHVEDTIEYQPAVATSYEPLADFNEPVASPSDVATLEEEDLYEADSVAAYISQVQAGEKPATPVALVGTSLADQLAQFTSTNTDELADLFGPETE